MAVTGRVDGSESPQRVSGEETSNLLFCLRDTWSKLIVRQRLRQSPRHHFVKQTSLWKSKGNV